MSTFPELRPRYNVAPTQEVTVIRHEAGDRHALSMQWGLVPSWAKDPKMGSRLINARSETAASKPSFRAAFQRRRCLVVADGYYEWKRVGGKKQPFLIRLHEDQPFGMAGLWESWRGDKTDSSIPPLVSCTILTTDSNELTSDLHDRMPVILQESDWEVWLDTSQDNTAAIQALMVPRDSDGMTMAPVSTYVNNSRHEGPACVEEQRELF